MAGYVFQGRSSPIPSPDDLKAFLTYLEHQLNDDFSPYYQFDCPFDMLAFMKEDIDRRDLAWTRKFVASAFVPMPLFLRPFRKSPLELLCDNLYEFINYIEINKSIFYV
jgi:hypothetical protein